MSWQVIKLIDRLGNVVADATVAEEVDRYNGHVNLALAPPEVRALFEEFDDVVNGQMLSFLDKIDDKIAALRIEAVFDDGRAVPVKDLQVYPSTGDISFKLDDRIDVPARDRTFPAHLAADTKGLIIPQQSSRDE